MNTLLVIFSIYLALSILSTILIFSALVLSSRKGVRNERARYLPGGTSKPQQQAAVVLQGETAPMP